MKRLVKVTTKKEYWVNKDDTGIYFSISYWPVQ